MMRERERCLPVIPSVEHPLEFWKISSGAETTPTLPADSRFRRILFPAFWYSSVERYRRLIFCILGSRVAEAPNKTRLNSPAVLARG